MSTRFKFPGDSQYRHIPDRTGWHLFGPPAASGAFTRRSPSGRVTDSSSQSIQSPAVRHAL